MTPARPLERSPWLRGALLIMLLLLVFLCGVHLVVTVDATHGLEVELAVLFQLTMAMALFVAGCRGRSSRTPALHFVRVARGAAVSHARSAHLLGVPLRR